MTIKKPRWAIVLLMTLALTGCWDAIEIEERAFVTTLGVDKYSAPPSEETTEAADPKDVPRKRYSFTYSMPSASFLLGQSEEANFLYSTVGENLHSASRNLTTRLNMQVFFGHLDAIVIGETLARDPHLFREILDVIERDSLISRRVKIVIVPKSAKDVLRVQPALTPVTGEFISGLFKNKEGSPRSGFAEAGDILEELHETGNTVIPRIVPGAEDIKIAGSAVFKDFQLQGWLGELETGAVEIIKGNAKFVDYSIPFGKEDVKSKEAHAHNYHIIAVGLQFLPTKFHLEKEDPIKITIEVKAEGEIEQFYLDPEQNLIDSEMIEKIERKVSKKISEGLEATIEKVQQEFEVDIIGAGDYISKYHPKLWKQIEEDWGEIFPTIDIAVEVSTIIRRTGMTR